MQRTLNYLTKILCLGLISFGSLPAFALVRLADLGPLEVKFFAHQYDKETPPERLDRLERLVFGKVQSGSVEERVAKLSKAVDGAGLAIASSSTATSSRTDAGAGATSTSASPTNASSARPSSEAKDTSGSSYPRVSELERAVLGKTFSGEPVRQRLSRLETKAYGKPSQIEDLATRVDKLSSYADVYGMQPADNFSKSAQSLRGLADLVDSTPHSRSMGMLDKVSALENSVFGHPTANQALVQRIKTLEASVFGASAGSAGEDMKTRVDQLWARVKPTVEPSKSLPSNQTAQTLQPFATRSYTPSYTPNYTANYSPNSSQQSSLVSDPYTPNLKHKNKGQHSSFLSKLGKAVAFAGSAAVGAGSLAVGAVGSMNMSTGYYGMGSGFGGSYPSSYGSYPSSYGSYAPGYGSMSSSNSFGRISSGGMMGSPFNSSYAGSFFSH